MRATEATQDEFPLELFSLQLELDDVFNQELEHQGKQKIQSPPNSTPGSTGYLTPTTRIPIELMNLNEPEQQNVFGPDFPQDFSTSLLDQLLMLQNQPEEMTVDITPTIKTETSSNVVSPKDSQPPSPYQLQVQVSQSQPMEVTQTPVAPTAAAATSVSPRKIAPKRSRSHSHTPVTYPTPSSTPPSPYSPYYGGASGPVTPAVTPSSVTPIMSPENSQPSSPRGSYYGGHKLVTKDTVKEEKLPRHKRPSHIRAEHKRRSKIQKGFEDIQMLIPSLAESNSTKPSKSAMLSKTVDYCRQLRTENKELQREADKVRKEIEALSSEIKMYQTQLPAGGVDPNGMPTAAAADAMAVAAAAATPTSSSSSSRVPGTTAKSMESMFSDYVRAKTLSNWKFSIFGKLIRPLFTSFNHAVNTSTMETFTRTVLTWLDEHCSLIALRPAVFEALRQVSTETSIMTNPEKVPDETIQNVLRESFPGAPTMS